MKTKIYIQNSRPISEDDCRMDEEIQERHIIVCFKQREYTSRLADWLDNTTDLRRMVRCVEYNSGDGYSRIDIQKPEEMSLRQAVRSIEQALDMFCLRYDWQTEVVDAVLY